MTRQVLHAMKAATIGVIVWIITLFLFSVAMVLVEVGIRALPFAAVISAYELITFRMKLVIIGGLVCAITASLGYLWKQRVRKTTLLAIYVPLFIASIVLAFGTWLQNRQDISAIQHQFSQFCSFVNERNYSNAYKYMSPEYRQTHSLGQFRLDENLQYGLYRNIEFYGCELSLDHHIEVLGKNAALYTEQHPPTGWYNGPDYELVKVDGVWWFTGESTLYSD